jgi:hypothetical protein
MATQLAERPSRMTSAPGTLGKIERLSNIKDTVNMVTSKPLTLNFICMILVAIVLDALGFFLAEFGVGFIFSLLGLLIFTPWFHFSGIAKFDTKRAVSMGTTSILEIFPITGNLPLITANVFFTYYSK